LKKSTDIEVKDDIDEVMFVYRLNHFIHLEKEEHIDVPAV
jgi:hypothetical protein